MLVLKSGAGGTGCFLVVWLAAVTIFFVAPLLLAPSTGKAVSHQRRTTERGIPPAHLGEPPNPPSTWPAQR